MEVLKATSQLLWRTQEAWIVLEFVFFEIKLEGGIFFFSLLVVGVLLLYKLNSQRQFYNFVSGLPMSLLKFTVDFKSHSILSG